MENFSYPKQAQVHEGWVRDSSYQPTYEPYPPPKRPKHWTPTILTTPALTSLLLLTLILLGLVEYAYRALPPGSTTQLAGVPLPPPASRAELLALYPQHQPRQIIPSELVAETTFDLPTLHPTPPGPGDDGGGNTSPTATFSQEKSSFPVLDGTLTVGPGTTFDPGSPQPSAASTLFPALDGTLLPAPVPVPGGGQGAVPTAAPLGGGAGAPNPAAGAGKPTPTPTPIVAVVPTNTVEVLTSAGVLVTTTRAVSHTITSTPFAAAATGTDKLGRPTSLPPSSSGSAGGTTGAIVFHFPKTVYILGTYGPLLLAVLYRLLWSAVYGTAKLVAPFHALASERGALGKDSLFIYYLSTNLTPNSLRGLVRGGHWTFACASVAYAGVTFMAPLASETLFVDFKALCVAERQCVPRLSVGRLSARLLEALLAGTALLILALIFLLRGRTSGVFADPSSIASIAALLGHPAVLDDFRALDPSCSAAEMRGVLGGKRYRLGYYTAPHSGQQRYGLIPAFPPAPSATYHPLPNPHPPPPTTSRPPAAARWRGVLHLARDALFALTLLAVLGLVAAYYRESGATPFNTFMNSETFGPRFTMTLLGSLIDAHWKRLERETRTLAPWRLLSGGGAPAGARKTILAGGTTTPVLTLGWAVGRRQWFLGFVAFTALVSEVLVVVLVGVPFSSGMTWTAYLVSSYLSLGILGFMVVALVGVMWWRRGIRWGLLPRWPDTVGAVAGYCCWGEGLLQGVEGLEECGRRERDRRVEGLGRRWVFGEEVAGDGVVRFVVDDEKVGEGPNVW